MRIPFWSIAAAFLTFCWMVEGFLPKFAAALLCVLYLLLHPRTVLYGATFIILFGMFSISYILTPWWYFYPEAHLRLSILAVTVTTGFAWSHFSAGDLVLKTDLKRHILFLFMIAGTLLAVHYRALFQDIAFMGDEDFHIGILLTLRRYLEVVADNSLAVIRERGTAVGIACAVMLGVGIHLARKTRSPHPIGWVLLVGMIAFWITVLMSAPFTDQVDPIAAQYKLPHFMVDHFTHYEFMRYPIFQKWADLPFVLSGLYRDNASFRAVPFMSVVLLAGFLYIQFEKDLHQRPLSMCAALAIVTTPLIVYYTGILYPDTAAMALMTMAVFSAPAVIRASFRELKSHMAWYLLILASFIKETSAISLAVLMGARLIHRGYQVLIQDRPLAVRIKAAAGEALVCSLPLIPVGIFVALWSVDGPLRPPPVTGGVHNLFIWGHYWILAKELCAELGVFVPFALAGAVILYRKDRTVFATTVLLFACNLLFFLSEGLFIGFARFNLTLMPPVIYWSYHFFCGIGKKQLLIAAVSSCVLFNWWLKPLHSDGSRVRDWGNPVFRTGEASYPYEQAVRRLAEAGNGGHLLVAGSHYPYYLIEYYMEKHGYEPGSLKEMFFPRMKDAGSEEAVFKWFLKNVQNKPDWILYHSQWNIGIDERSVERSNYAVDRKIRNQANSLYVLRRTGVKTGAGGP